MNLVWKKVENKGQRQSHKYLYIVIEKTSRNKLNRIRKAWK